MTDKLWKQAERRIASLLGGERVPVTGRRRGDAPDIEHAQFAVEVKHRQSLPSWLMDAMNQADECNPGDKISVVILHEKGKNYGESLVLLRLSDVIILKNQIDELTSQVEDLRDDLRVRILTEEIRGG